ncbi:MAG: dTDP-4-dehydrorhamnose 3,5-epimerase [Melioribacteraceae bacterium]|nr:dTDP-4-dehydrorhamnose 3,5-epimerase [Melioribacteraceae bacterium]
METKEREIKGVFEISLKPIEDERGFFMRVFDEKIFEEFGTNRKWVQENHSKSTQKGIIRGLHFQVPPFAETKLVRCIKGAVLDVFVDLRKDSDSFGRWGSIELTENNKKMILIPRGFAHGFCTLTDDSEVLYKVDNYYSKEHEVGLLWKDGKLNINWPISEPILSEKDKSNITFEQFVNKYQGIEV